MKTNFASHYKFSLSKKLLFLISAIFTTLLLAGTAFAISQIASATDETLNESVPNYSMNVVAVNQNPQDGGSVTKNKLTGEGNGNYRAVGYKLESKSTGQSLWIPDELYAKDNNNCIFTGFYDKFNGKKIGEDYQGVIGDTIEARFRSAVWTTFNNADHCTVVVKDASGTPVENNKIKLLRNSTCKFYFNKIEFYDPDDATILEGSVEITTDPGYFLQNWDPEFPKIISEAKTYTPVIKEGYMVNVTWDKTGGNVLRNSEESAVFPFGVEKGWSMDVNYEGVYPSIMFYDVTHQGEDLAEILEADVKKDYVFDGWYRNGVKLKDSIEEVTEDLEIEARFVYVHCNMTFKVDDSQWAFGKVSENSLVADYGTTYTLSGDSIVFDDAGSVAAIPTDERYQFDYWTVNKQVIVSDGEVHSDMEFVAHFKIKGNWRITGSVVRENELHKEVPVAYARVIFYYEDAEHSKSHVAAECSSDENGIFALSIPEVITKGYLDGIDEDYGISSEPIEKPEGNIDGKKIKIEQDPKYVYFFGTISDQKSYSPVVNADVAFSYDDDGSFVCAQTDSRGTYYLKVDKTRGSGILFVSAYEYILCFKQYQGSDLGQKYVVPFTTDILAMGIPNTFTIPEDTLCDGYDCDIYINNRLRLFDRHITQNICLAPPQYSADKFSVKKDQVTLQYVDYERGSSNVKFVVKPTIKSGGMFFNWFMNGEITPDFDLKELKIPNTFEPNVGYGVDISGLIKGETDASTYAPLSGADVYFTDYDFNVIAHTQTDTNIETNYAFPAIPQQTEGYFIVLKSGYKPHYEVITKEQTSKEKLTIDASLDLSSEEDDAYLYGSAIDDKSGQAVPNAFIGLFNEDGDILASTESSSTGEYLLKYKYSTKATLVCLSDGYKPIIQPFESQDYVKNVDFRLEKNINSVNATFSKSDHLNKFEIEILSADEKISYCKFDYKDNFNLIFEKNTKYIASDNKISFIYGNYMFRIIADATDEYIFKTWNINPVPSRAGFLEVDSVFVPQFTKFFEMNASWDSNYGNVTSTKKPLPFLEEQATTFSVVQNTITFVDNQLIASASEDGMFLGWYVDGQLLEDTTYAVGKDVEFEARFIYKYRNVSFKVPEDQTEMGKVEPKEIVATYGDTYTITSSTITVGQNSAVASSLDSGLYVFDYWTLNGEKVSGTGIVYEPMTFVAHFKDRDPWHVSGKVYTTTQKEVTVSGANIFAYDSTGSVLIDSATSLEDGSYSLVIPQSKKSITLYAVELDTGYHVENVNKPESGEDVILDLTLDRVSSFTILYGNVTKEGTTSPLEGVDVYFLYDASGLAPMHVSTSKDGSYVFDVFNTSGGTLYFISDGYTIKSKHFTKKEITDKFLLNYSETLIPSLSQTITFPSDGSCSSIQEVMTFEGKTILNTPQTLTFSFGVAKNGSQLEVDGNKVIFNYTVMDDVKVEYTLTANNNPYYKFSHWLLNGAQIEDGATIDVTQANELTPVSVPFCEISGTIFTDSSEVANDLAPVDGVQVVFYDDNNQIIASDVSNNEGKWSFGDTVVKGSFGNIVYLKSEFKPQLKPIFEHETLKDEIVMSAILQKSEEADDCYVYGQVAEKTEANVDPVPIPNAYIMFYNTEDGTYKECYADDKGTYLLTAEKNEEGYLLCMADGYRPSFNEFIFDDYIKLNPFSLEKLHSDVNVDFPFAYNQKCYQIEVMDKTTGEVYANFDYFDSLNLNFANSTSYHIGNNHVIIYGEFYYYKFTAIPVENYDFYSWNVYPAPTTEGQLDRDTSFTPNFVYQTSPVILNAGEAVNGFNYKYYIGDTLIWDKDEDYVQDESYVNTVITVNEDGIIESHFNVDLENNEGEVDLWSRVTPQAEDGYVFDSLYVNDKLLEPGDELVVENGNYYFGEINYKFVPQPVPPTPTPDDPEFVNGGSTGDSNLVMVLMLLAIVVIAGAASFVTDKNKTQ